VPSHPEADFADTLMDLIDECDVLLDLHSYSCGKGPFITLDYPTQANKELAAIQGVPDWVTGWPEIYQAAPGLNAGDTTQYANETGKMGIVVECGQHSDPAAINVAYACIRRTLAYYEMMDIGSYAFEAEAPRIVRFTGIVAHDRPGAFAREWQNLDRVKAGTPMILYEDGSVLTATEPSVIILPDPIAAPGAEWLYLAREGE
jgi:predicted deacylase